MARARPAKSKILTFKNLGDEPLECAKKLRRTETRAKYLRRTRMPALECAKMITAHKDAMSRFRKWKLVENERSSWDKVLESSSVRRKIPILAVVVNIRVPRGMVAAQDEGECGEEGREINVPLLLPRRKNL